MLKIEINLLLIHIDLVFTCYVRNLTSVTSISMGFELGFALCLSFEFYYICFVINLAKFFCKILLLFFEQLCFSILSISIIFSQTPYSVFSNYQNVLQFYHNIPHPSETQNKVWISFYFYYDHTTIHISHQFEFHELY